MEYLLEGLQPEVVTEKNSRLIAMVLFTLTKNYIKIIIISLNK